MKLSWNFSQRTQPIYFTRHKTHVLGHFGPFCYSMKVDAKLAEQVLLAHKFAKQNGIRIFHNERTRSTPMDPKLMFWGHFGPFHYCTKVNAKLAELAPLAHKFGKRRSIGTFRNERTRSTPLDPKLMFWGVSDDVNPFGFVPDLSMRGVE
jgi:hypothetical protein